MLNLTLKTSIHPARSEITHLSLSSTTALAVYPTTNQTTQSWIDTFSLPALKSLSKTSGSQAIFSPVVDDTAPTPPRIGLGSSRSSGSDSGNASGNDLMATLRDWTVQLGSGVEHHHASTVLLRNLRSGKSTLEIRAARSAPLAFSQCGGYLAAGDGPSTERLGVFNVKTGARVGMVTGHIDKITHAAFTSDGNLVTCGKDGVVRVTDWKKGRTLFRLETESFNPRLLCVPTTGAMISIWGRDIYIWRPVTSELTISSLSTLRQTEGWPLAFSADGRYLACKTEDGFDVMEVSSGAVIAERKDEDREMVSSAAFSGDGGLLLVGYLDGRVELWEVGTEKI